MVVEEIETGIIIISCKIKSYLVPIPSTTILQDFTIYKKYPAGYNIWLKKSSKFGDYESWNTNQICIINIIKYDTI